MLCYLTSSTPRLHKTVFTELGNYLTAFRLCNSRGRKIMERKGEERKAKRSGEKTSTWTMRGIASSSTSICAAAEIDKRAERINSGAASSDDFKAGGREERGGRKLTVVWKLGAFPALTQPFASPPSPPPLRSIGRYKLVSKLHYSQLAVSGEKIG